MAASKSTVELVLDVIEKHVSPQIMGAITKELLEVPGNKSFRDTVKMLHRRASERIVR